MEDVLSSSTRKWRPSNPTSVEVIPSERESSTKKPDSEPSKHPVPFGQAAVVPTQAAHHQNGQVSREGDNGHVRSTEVVNGTPTVSVYLTVTATVTEKERETQTVTLLVPTS